MVLDFWDFHVMIDEEMADQEIPRIGTAFRLLRRFLSM